MLIFLFSALVADLYASIVGQSVLIHQLLASLQSKLREETRLQKEMFRLLGSLDLIMAAATVSNEPDDAFIALAAEPQLNATAAADNEHAGKRKAASDDSAGAAPPIASASSVAVDNKKLKR